MIETRGDNCVHSHVTIGSLVIPLTKRLNGPKHSGCEYDTGRVVSLS